MAWHLKEPSRIKSQHGTMAQRESVEIVAKRATGSRIVGNQGETRKVKLQNGTNPKTKQNKPKRNQIIMISHLLAQKAVWQ